VGMLIFPSRFMSRKTLNGVVPISKNVGRCPNSVTVRMNTPYRPNRHFELRKVQSAGDSSGREALLIVFTTRLRSPASRTG